MIIVNNYDKDGKKINPSDIKITDLVIYEIVKKYAHIFNRCPKRIFDKLCKKQRLYGI